MAYDSETYGQSPFGNSSKSAVSKEKSAETSVSSTSNGSSTSTGQEPEDSFGVSVDNEQADSLDIGPDNLAAFPSLTSSPTSSATSKAASKATRPNKAKKKTSHYKRSSTRSRKSAKDTSAAEASAFANALNPENISPTVGRLSEKLGIGKVLDQVSSRLGSSGTSARLGAEAQSSTKGKKAKASKSSARKSSTSKKKAEEAAQIEAEAAAMHRFQEEDRRAYLSLLYKTGVSALVWAVLRLSRHEFSDDVDRIINTFIHPALIAVIALLSAVALTFWLRHILRDLAKHTQQLSADAEETGGKNYRPTLEIVGDSLEYNPQLRKKLSTLFNVTTSLICSLISYLVVFAAFP